MCAADCCHCRCFDCRHAWSGVGACRKNELEELMLLNLSKKTWTEGLLLHNFTNHAASNEKVRSTGCMHTNLLCSAAQAAPKHAEVGAAVISVLHSVLDQAA
jgi:hypothetical protein